MPKKLAEEAIQKMKDLRAQGLSNSKISLELGVSVLTVRRHIGVQPLATRARAGEICAYTHDKSFIEFDACKAPNTLNEISRISRYEGKNNLYELDFIQNKIRIQDKEAPSFCFEFSFPEWNWFTVEIAQVQRCLMAYSQKPQTL